jgi:hypothetical protein
LLKDFLDKREPELGEELLVWRQFYAQGFGLGIIGKFGEIFGFQRGLVRIKSGKSYC